MRPSLLHLRDDPRHSRPRRRGARARGSSQAERGQAPRAERAAGDPAVQRARQAGGPVDHASYSCQCGYLFRAEVSTTVTCPHCGAGQAW